MESQRNTEAVLPDSGELKTLSDLVAPSSSFMILEDRNLWLLTPKEGPGSQEEREDGSGAGDGQHHAQHGPCLHLRGGARQAAPTGSPSPLPCAVAPASCPTPWPGSDSGGLIACGRDRPCLLDCLKTDLSSWAAVVPRAAQ